MDNFIDLKWGKLLRRAELFVLIPFVEIVFVAGSMAMGNVKENSDFDLIIGVRSGRIFTVRAFCFFMFGILGWRRKRGASGKDTKDKFCFSHFVTPERYSLSGPYNEYWQRLYGSLVPIYGDDKLIQRFYDANALWMKEGKLYGKDIRHLYSKSGYSKIFLEKILDGKLGDLLEELLKDVQIKKIEGSLRTEKQYKPRIIFNDRELEFHPDTRRIEDMLDRKEF